MRKLITFTTILVVATVMVPQHFIYKGVETLVTSSRAVVSTPLRVGKPFRVLEKSITGYDEKVPRVGIKFTQRLFKRPIIFDT